MTVRTSRNAFFPCSFDSPPARARMSTGTSARAARVVEPEERLDLGRARRVRLCEHRQRRRRGRVHAARRVVEGPAERDAHRAPQQAGAEPADRSGA